ncbi:MAG: phosphoribosylformylglycinamidine synthase subunit PurL [Acidobacteria bacterium]|nr:phosphoribosylformylglycinamidine synthase subunit PurL [Acidobacteriota bacterium]
MTTAAPKAITEDLIRDHGLSAEEYEKIKRLLGGREPTFTELGVFSVMWSEHCSYKSSRVHLKRLPTRSRRVLQGPGENAGIIDIGEGWACAFKIESHNHPSFIEPFQGAATGVGGILRDIFTMGARPVAVLDSLRFGPVARRRRNGPGADERVGASVPTREEIARNHSLLEGVVGGIASYGNCFGVANLGGETKFEPCYSSNPLVNAFALGLLRRDQIFYARAAGEGNAVIYVGAKTGRDGIHGATMASEEFSERSEGKRPNVQVGDPFLEKLLLEACLEAMQTGAIVGIQDMGAAGLTCSTAEMSARGQVGMEIELDRVPQRETGMTAYEIMLSESQERMLLVCEKGREQEVFRVFEKWGLDAIEVGHVTSDRQLCVLQHGQVVAEIPTQALTDDAPVYRRSIERWEPPVAREIPEGIRLGKPGDLTDELKQLLEGDNIYGKRWIWQQYDSMVQTNTVAGPAKADAGVIRIKGSQRGLAMALDGNGRWCYLDPRLGAMHALAEAARNVACAGATPVGATNCLNFGNPEKPKTMWQFSQVIDGLTRACEELDIPITGGNVSFYNETVGEGIYPTPVLGVVGVFEDVDQAAQIGFVEPGRALVLLRATSSGDLTDAESEFGSSEYAKVVIGSLWGYPPELNLEKEAALGKCLVEMIQARIVDSAHDCSDGGLAVTLVESTFPFHVGLQVRLSSEGLPPEFVLFGEDAGRVVVSCDPGKRGKIEKLAASYGVEAKYLGETISQKVEIRLDGALVVSARVADLCDIYERALEKALRSEAEPVAAD